MECDPSENLGTANRDRHHRNRGRNCNCRQHPPGVRSPRVIRWKSFLGLGTEWALGPRHTSSDGPLDPYAMYAI